MTAKTKRDRSAGRAHRHTAIQGIINNHQGLIDDIANIDNSIAVLQGETCDIGGKLVIWSARAEEQNIRTWRLAVETERKVAEIEPALALVQEFTRQQATINTQQVGINKMTHGVQKEHQEAIAQLTAYVNKVNGRADALQQEVTLLREELDETNKRLIQFAWVNTVIWLSAALTIFALLIVP